MLMLYIGIGILIIFVFLVFMSYRKKKKANKLLTEKSDEIQNQAKKLQMINEKLHKLDKFKENMISMIVHDLKNPIIAIIGISSDIKDSEIKKVFHYSGNKMYNLIQNMLDVYKFEETDIKLNLNQLSIFEITENVIKENWYFCEQKNISVQNRIHPAYEAELDKSYIERILGNLLINAAKNSKNNDKIIISCEQEDNYLKISFTDNGCGIPKSYQDKIFDKYTKVNNSDAGTGIGLAFCKMIIEAHKGNIGVISEKEKGATFWFTLPYTNPIEINNGKVYIKEWKTNIELSQKDKELLSSLVKKIKPLQIVEVTNIKTLLATIDEIENPRISHWHESLLNAVFEHNQEQYNQLLNIVIVN